MQSPRRAGALMCLLSSALVLSTGCEDDTASPDTLEDAPPVIQNYAALVLANYSEALTLAEQLQVTVDAFVAAPSEDTLEAARGAWLAAREAYGQTEAFRFYDGPIDAPESGPEGRINAWPLDEAFIDYVEGNANAGIINDEAQFPTLTQDVLVAQNESGSETNISTGYHAIEFLLWGQDLSAEGPGHRPYTDYVAGGTAANQVRRGTYLKEVTALLVQDLEQVTQAWQANEDNYAADFQALDRKEALRRMLQGMGSLAGAELSGERMTTALDNKDQEDEHSCFSDNTHRDLYNNALAVQNVYLGQYGTLDGAGLDTLVSKRSPELDAQMKARLATTLAAIEAIPAPFDQAILGDAVSLGRLQIQEAVEALQAETETIVEIASLLGIQLNLE